MLQLARLLARLREESLGLTKTKIRFPSLDNSDFFSIGSILIILGGIAPLILKPVYKIWMIFAVIIGWIMTRIILSVLFFSIITIIGLFTRLLGKDFLNLKSKSNESYWNVRNKEHELNQDYEKQF